jgi:hypothetical protein
MVRCDKGRFASVQDGVFQLEAVIEIDMVEVEHRQKAGEGPRPAKMQPRIDASEIRFEQTGGHAADPFIEIARDDPASDDLGPVDNASRKQAVNLLPPFKKGGSHMDIHKVQGR